MYTEIAIRNSYFTRLAFCICIGLTGLLSSCSSGELQLSGSQKIYRNGRFGYEFPYPSNWIPDRSPGNRDGQVFLNPTNPAMKIQGWASNELPAITAVTSASAAESLSASSLQRNFETDQGLQGNLQVEIGEHISSIALTVVQAEISYSFQAQSPNEDFATYYPLFYSIARQYRIQPQLE